MFDIQIKKLRKYFGMTQTQFAEHLGKGMRTVQNWENGSNIPSVSVLTHICKTFGVSEAWLLTGKGEMFEKTSNSQYAVGTNIIQSNGHGSVLQILTSSDRIKEAVNDDVQELVELIVQYATPAMIREWKKKLLQIKKLHEE